MKASLPLTFEEQIVYRLRYLYTQYGYTQYRMSKFEEYDLYARNKDFLISDNVITFTDTDGKLMALKPDVTLSIVKNNTDINSGVKKLYYNENVYRVAKGSRSFRELVQVGLECIGNVDDFCICEVLTLACESLKSISSDSVLTVSHLGLLLAVLDDIGFPNDDRSKALKAVGQKNIHELTEICTGAGVPQAEVQLLTDIVSLKGKPCDVVRKLHTYLQGRQICGLTQLERIAPVLEASCGSRVRLDFSVVEDVQYYSGIVFKGFVAGLPGSVLTGGQYDKLMRKMGRSAAAIGFAVYVDGLDRLNTGKHENDADILLLYRDTDPMLGVLTLADQWRQRGYRVMVYNCKPDNMRFGRICYFDSEER